MKDVSLFHYRGCIPEILLYQFITKSILGAIVALLTYAASELVWTTGRSAVTSGDLPYLMRSWQGWIILLIGLAVLIIYTIFDINAMVLLADRILHQKKKSVWRIMAEAFSDIRLYRSVRGLLSILFVAFAVPLIGAGAGISLTSSFYIPNFITSVIMERLLYRILYYGGLLAIAVTAFLYLFLFQFVILERKSVTASMRESRHLMQKHWKDFLKRYLLFLAKTLLVMALVVLVLGLIAAILLEWAEDGSRNERRYVAIFFGFLALAAAGIFSLLFVPFHTMELNRIYESYTAAGENSLAFPVHRIHGWMTAIAIVAVIYMAYTSFEMGQDFDLSFPKIDRTQVIAHRAGGNLGNENTVFALNAAIKAGADGGEMDVQRTKDGYYIINHDDTFKRLCGVNRKVSDMTLDEIKKLKIPDFNDWTHPDTNVATLEDMLTAAKGKIHLYIELKGPTADRKMADDVYQIVKSHDMLDDVTFICLKYPLISYLETSHPEADTGYLCYASFGDLQDLNCDELILEEETATAANIDRIHDAGKKAGVWTVDKLDGMVRFMARGADGIITNDVYLGINTRSFLHSSGSKGLDDLIRIAARLVYVYW